MNILYRLVWTVTIGWWIGLLWIALACLLALTVIWYNVGLYMIVNTLRLVTLASHPREIITDVRRVR